MFFWEIQSIESVMADGVQRAIVCDFEVGEATYTTARTKWRLHLDVVNDEPALVVQKLSPTNKPVFYRLSIQVMKSPEEETDIIGYPNTKLFYEASDSNQTTINKDDIKFELHRQLAYGCNYTTWFQDAVVNDSLLLRIDFETCESTFV
ncbi:hypothetical protein Ocin01_08734 [Orchesella cincta]|uniref:Uncharacterized protein n=1 Tax=Orchesella cincta TaxID=48709 RepID=A0A1D2MZ64_ORCCI|nr:hypothetical protein Ocin01_08734 [Orchesella cincta]